MWLFPCTIQINQNLHDEFIQRIMISMKAEDIMDQDLHNGWKYLTYTGIKSQDLKSHDTIYKIPPVQKVFYTNRYEYMYYYVNIGVKVEHSSPSSDYWSLMYIVNPPIMKMGIKVLECKLTSVNKCVEVEHLRGSINQGTLMYPKNYRWRENLPLMTTSLQALNGFQISIPEWIF